MSSNATRTSEHAAPRALFLAFELGLRSWKLALGTSPADKPRVRNIPGRDLKRLRAEIASARKAFGLPAGAPVHSCYEAGRDGFWLHRLLESEGISNVVVDPSSLQVDRRRRRAKTDQIDAHRLLSSLFRHCLGERGVWSVVRVPSPEAEDARNLHRSREAIKRDRTRHVNRIKGLLMAQGHDLGAMPKDLPALLDRVRLWDGSELPAGVRSRLDEEWERYLLADRQLRDLEQAQRKITRESDAPSVERVRRLMTLGAIGEQSAWTFVMEFFGWREFRNRKEVGALAGLAPVPFQSGEEDHDRGISKAGNRHVRGMVIDIAWQWLRWQPDSALARWYDERFAHGGKRMRKVGIVALARKLLIALWHYVDHGVIPEGATLKA